MHIQCINIQTYKRWTTTVNKCWCNSVQHTWFLTYCCFTGDERTRDHHQSTVAPSKQQRWHDYKHNKQYHAAASQTRLTPPITPGTDRPTDYSRHGSAYWLLQARIGLLITQMSPHGNRAGDNGAPIGDGFFWHESSGDNAPLKRARPNWTLVCRVGAPCVCVWW